MQRWVRFEHQGREQLGLLQEDRILVHSGDLYNQPQPTGVVLTLAEVQLRRPVQPTKVIALWNNFMALAAKLGLQDPAEPLYLIKPPNSYLDPEATIRQPAQPGKVVFEGELGIVIGRTATQVSEALAMDHVFGYTCANDVTHADILNRDASFAQWVRAKGFDTFCPLGPCVASGLQPEQLVVTTRLNGEVRQNYPISDMRFSVARLVSAISADMTLYPGDVILCGTSVGVGSMKPGSTVEVSIEGIGTLRNHFE